MDFTAEELRQLARGLQLNIAMFESISGKGMHSFKTEVVSMRDLQSRVLDALADKVAPRPTA